MKKTFIFLAFFCIPFLASAQSLSITGNNDMCGWDTAQLVGVPSGTQKIHYEYTFTKDSDPSPIGTTDYTTIFGQASAAPTKMVLALDSVSLTYSGTLAVAAVITPSSGPDYRVSASAHISLCTASNGPIIVQYLSADIAAEDRDQSGGAQNSQGSSAALAVTGIQKAGTAYIAPNPVNSSAVLTVPFATGSVQIFDAFGRLVQKYEATNSACKISAADLPPGIYLYRALSATEQYQGNFQVLH